MSNTFKISYYVSQEEALYWLHNVPFWLANASEGENAAKVFDRCYAFGGWRPLRNEKTTLDMQTGEYQYPGDPKQKPLFKIEYNNEVIYGYRSEMWAIVQKDGSFELSRMD